MNLASMEFAAFAGVLLVLYYRIPAEAQWKLLLAAGTVFYLRAGPMYMGFLLFVSLSAFFTARRMERSKAQTASAQERKRKNRPLLILCLVANFSLLLLCKASLLRPTEEGILSLGLPMGMSFYLFQSMGYVIDVYRGRAEGESRFLRFHLFASYFPLLVQGPICRYTQLSQQLFAPHSYDRQAVSFGLQRMLWGYFKKLVIADRLGPMVAALRSAEASGGAFFLLTLFYGVQIYADFTGGMDVVLGLSQSLGIELPENFQLPFFSKNIAEYWRRWHITLGEWMKDYVFYPVSVSLPLRRLNQLARKHFGNRAKRLTVSLATIITWAATGIWHGLTPNFLLWGMLNCGVILLSGALTPLYDRFHSRFHLREKRWYGGFQMLRTFLLMNLIRACDLFPDPRAYFRGMASLVTKPGFALPEALSGVQPVDMGILVIGIALMMGVSLLQERGTSVRRVLWRKGALLRFAVFFALFLAVLLMGCYGIGYREADFIYNQF